MDLNVIKNIKSHNRKSLQSYDSEEFLNEHTKIIAKGTVWWIQLH